MKKIGNSISTWKRDCYLSWVFALFVILISVYKILTQRKVTSSDSLSFPDIDLDLSGESQASKNSTDPYADLPTLDATRNLPVIRFFVKRRNKYIWAIGFCWLVIFLPGVITNSLNGSLITISSAIRLSQKIPETSIVVREILMYVSRSNPKLSFFDDFGIILIVAILFPLFFITEMSIYPKFGSMIAQFHVERIHINIAKRKTYEDLIKKYDRKFNSPMTNIVALCFSALTIFLLIRSRMQLDWWGDYSRFSSNLYIIIIFTFGCYHLWGIGTIKGWATISLCREYFSSDSIVLNLEPYHPDRSYGLGKIGQLLVYTFLMGLFTGATIFCLYLFNVFQDWTGVFTFFVVLGVINYSIFVSYPMALIIDQSRKFRHRKLSIINKKIQEVLNVLNNNKIWNPDLNIELDIYLVYLDKLIKSWHSYDDMHSLPLTLRQISIGLVFYLAQVGQLLVILNIIID